MAEKLEWLPVGFDPAAFDLDEVNRALQEGPMPDLEEWHPGISDLMVRDGSLGATGLTALMKEALRDDGDVEDAVVAAATLRYRVLLRTIGRGLDLTAAGYLPPTVVDGLSSELDLGAEWIGKGNREHLTLPVLTLRESATALGLVRKARGRLTVTKAGLALVDDPWRLLDHVRAGSPSAAASSGTRACSGCCTRRRERTCGNHGPRPPRSRPASAGLPAEGGSTAPSATRPARPSTCSET